MSHRKVYSQGSIPFSWEDKPGISKVTNQAEYSIEYGVEALDLTSSSSSSASSSFSNGSKVSPTYNDLKIPLPPCPIPQPPSRSSSTKGLKWQADPFLLAYKECTKPIKKGKSNNGQQNKKGTKVKKSLFTYFSCKSTCEVKDENIVKLPQLPALPKHKFHNVMMENW